MSNLVDFQKVVFERLLRAKVEETLKMAVTNNFSPADITRYIIYSQIAHNRLGVLNLYTYLDDDSCLRTTKGIDSVGRENFEILKKRYPDIEIMAITDTVRIRDFQRLEHPNADLLALYNS